MEKVFRRKIEKRERHRTKNKRNTGNSSKNIMPSRHNNKRSKKGLQLIKIGKTAGGDGITIEMIESIE